MILNLFGKGYIFIPGQQKETQMTIQENNARHELPEIYIEDTDTPLFDYLHRRIVTKNFVLEPLTYSHFLDLFEFRLQNEPEDTDPFDDLGGRLEEAYTQFFMYLCKTDTLAWVMVDRIYTVGFFLLEFYVDYNDYSKRNAHLYYEMARQDNHSSIHREMIKGIADMLFSESDIPTLILNIDDAADESEVCSALEQLSFSKRKDPGDGEGFTYILKNKDPRVSMPPRHIKYILRSYEKSD